MRLQNNTCELFIKRDRRISACNNAIQQKRQSLTPTQIDNNPKLSRQAHELIIRVNETIKRILQGK